MVRSTSVGYAFEWGKYVKLLFKGENLLGIDKWTKNYVYDVCPCPRAIHKDLYDSIQVYTRSQVRN